MLVGCDDSVRGHEVEFLANSQGASTRHGQLKLASKSLVASPRQETGLVAPLRHETPVLRLRQDVRHVCAADPNNLLCVCCAIHAHRTTTPTPKVIELTTNTSACEPAPAACARIERGPSVADGNVHMPLHSTPFFEQGLSTGSRLSASKATPQGARETRPGAPAQRHGSRQQRTNRSESR